MDGTQLVYERGALPIPVNVSPLERLAKPRRRSRWRKFALLPIVGVALGASLFVVDNALTHRAPPQPRNVAPPPNVMLPSAELAAAPSPATSDAPAAPQVDAESVSADAPARPTMNRVRATGRALSAARRAPTHAPSTTLRREEATRRREEKRTKPSGESAKRESKLGSILKKTGRALKKPFGF
ncbi:MAG TPA: hypothetical protein VFX96_16830 [Pyrinomonadaceae bacterium]|nr:hypothetical protein [Pyrinomonadaceae bacterium]